MRYIKEILKNVIHKNTSNEDNATVVGASIARPSSKARPHIKITLITLPILLLLIVALITLGITNAANNATEPETEQTFTEEGDGYYIWVRAVDHAGNKGPWSEAQRVWIDTGAPKITIKTNSNTTWAKTGSVTVALQDSKSGLAAGAKLKYGWSTSNSTAPSGYTDVTPSYTAGTTSEVTFTASASGLTGKYYLWVVPTTLADTAGNSQTTTAKSTGQFYFDNNDPTVGTVTMKLGSSSGSDYTNNSWTNQSVYVAKNNGADGSGESGHSETTWTIAGTAESGTSKTLDPGSGVSKTYSIVVTTADQAGNNASNKYTINIDKVAPNITNMDMQYVYGDWSRYTQGTWTSAGVYAARVSGSPGPTGASDANSGLAKYQISSDNSNWYDYAYTTSDGMYVMSSTGIHTRYFRAVDVAGNASASISRTAQIDTAKPTVKANNSSVTITAGQSYAMSSYFTTGANGSAGISSTVYTINGTSYTNTSGLVAGTYTVTCTVTKVTGKTNSANMTLVVGLPTTNTVLASGNGSVTFTVPAGVKYVKVASPYADNTWYKLQCNTANCPNGKPYKSGNSNSIHMRVSPGKTYTITWTSGEFADDVKVYYSTTINEFSHSWYLNDLH